MSTYLDYLYTLYSKAKARQLRLLVLMHQQVWLIHTESAIATKLRLEQRLRRLEHFYAEAAQRTMCLASRLRACKRR